MAITKAKMDAIQTIFDAIIKQADAMALTFEECWMLSRNPVFAWLALRVLLDPRRPPQTLPEWLREYLCEAAINLTSAIAFADPTHAPEIIPQALGLSKKGRSIIDDAKALIDAPVIYGLYEHFKKTAPPEVRGKAEWAATKIKTTFSLQSFSVAQARIREAKQTVAALIAVRGAIPTEEAISHKCSVASQFPLAIIRLIGPGGIPSISEEDLRKVFAVPLPRRETILAALKPGGSL